MCREALGISLAGNVVVFDEAHNLVDAINAAHSCTVSAVQLRAAHRQAIFVERAAVA